MHVHIKPFLPTVAKPRVPLTPAAPRQTSAYGSLSPFGQHGGRGGASPRRQGERQKHEPDREDARNGNAPSSALAVLLVTLDLDAAR